MLNAQKKGLILEKLFSSNSMKTSISGEILFDETLRQTSSSGISIPELIKKADLYRA